MKTPEGSDILDAVDGVKQLANDISRVFSEHMIMDREELSSHLSGIHRECEELEKRLLLLYATGYARLDRINKGKR